MHLRDKKATDGFRLTVCILLKKLSQELTFLERHLTDDFDKNDLKAFVSLVVAAFSDLQAGTFAIQSYAEALGIGQAEEVQQLIVRIRDFQTEGFRLLSHMTIKGNRAMSPDFETGIELIRKINSGIELAITEYKLP